jgi:pilus assembly protein Flp/PilA
LLANYLTEEQRTGCIALYQVLKNSKKGDPEMLFEKKEKGQGMVEYALIIVLIAIVVIAALTLAGTAISSIFARIATALGGGE